MNHNSRVNSVKDISTIVFAVYATVGLSLGLMQYTYLIFLYEHFGSNATALKLSVLSPIISSLITFLLEVPTGVLGDHIGRKKTIICALVVGALGGLFRTWVCFTPSVFFSMMLVVAASFSFALNRTFFSGSFTAWVVDSIRERNVVEGHGPILSRAYSVMIVVKLIGAFIGMALYLSGWISFAFSVGCIGFVLCTFYCAAMMKETESLPFYSGKLFLQESKQKMQFILKDGLATSFKMPAVLYLIILNACMMTLIYVVLFLWTIVMKDNFGASEKSFYWYVVVAVSFMTSLLGARSLEKLNAFSLKKFGKILSNEHLWFCIVAVCLLMSGSVMALGLTKLTATVSILFFIAVIGLVNIGYGFLQPAYETLINNYIPHHNSQHRATVMSLSSMVLEVFFVVFLYFSSGENGEQAIVGWILPAGLLLLVTTVTHILLRRYRQKSSKCVATGDAAGLSAIAEG